MPPLDEWFFVRYDDTGFTMEGHPPGGDAWKIAITWDDIIRVCFAPGDLFDQDEIYVFTKHRPQSYVIPTGASGALELWNQLIECELFDAQLAIEAATKGEGLYCWPPPTKEEIAASAKSGSASESESEHEEEDEGAQS
jgi:hypothetical protein